MEPTVTAETRWRQVTVASINGLMHAGWIPAAVADGEGELVNINGECFTIMALYPSVTTRDNKLPLWDTAKPWEDPEEADGQEDSAAG
jgi:hypothetical protein